MSIQKRNSILFATKDDSVSATLFELLGEFGSLPNLSILDIVYFEKDNARIDTLANSNRLVVTLNLDYTGLLSKTQFENISVVAPKIKSYFRQFFNKINLIGFQRHLINESELIGIDRNKKNNYSLGLISQNLSVAEPTFRNSDVINVDLSVIRRSDLGLQSTAPIAGLSVEKFFQLVKLMGYSDKLRLVNFEYELSHDSSPDDIAEILATAIWYLAESRASLIDDKDLEIHYVQGEGDDFIAFSKSINSIKCWFQMENDNHKHACTLEEFNQAVVEGKISERIRHILF